MALFYAPLSSGAESIARLKLAFLSYAFIASVNIALHAADTLTSAAFFAAGSVMASNNILINGHVLTINSISAIHFSISPSFPFGITIRLLHFFIYNTLYGPFLSEPFILAYGSRIIKPFVELAPDFQPVKFHVICHMSYFPVEVLFVF